ncbi:phage tail tape measure protein [Paenibacillus sp. NRS-1783]|uniref:phage tail tape measure protein n=1 Tax=Paenibacillus sp. NRS-1783 TaxID=3233907 RepID=UPI003D2C22F2
MAETIKGINVVIGAETTGLGKALADVNKQSRGIQSELRQVEKLLKLDPGNTELLAQKQKLLANAVGNTQEKLNRLRLVQEQVSQQFARGDITEGQYRAFQREVAKTEAELNRLNGQLDDTTREIDEQGKKVSKLGKDYREAFEQAKQAMGNSFEQMKKVGAGITAFGAAIAGGLGVAVKSATDFEQGMANAYSVMAPEEVSKFRKELEQLAITMGAQTKYSATEAAQGIEELIKAGVSVQDVMKGGLSGALSLATAGELELGDAAEIASTALNAFKSDAISVQDAADVLAGAANASATSVSELKFGLSQAAAVASGVGLSFKDTATTLAVFAQNGLKGSDAGTSLKTMLLRLTPTTDAAASEFDRLGLYSFNAQKAMDYLVKHGVKPTSSATKDVVNAMMSYSAQIAGVKVGTSKANKAFDAMAFNSGAMSSAFYDANGNLKSMAEIADILQNALKGMTAEQRQVSLNTLFGSDAIRGANILFKEGAKGVEEMAAAMGKISAQDVAAQKLDTFKGAMEELNGSVETAQISIGRSLIPALRTLAGVVQSAVDVFNGLSDGTKNFIAVAGAITAVIALIVGPMLILAGFIPQIAAGLSMLAPAFAVLTGPIGIAVAAIASVVAGLTYLYNTNETVRNGLNAAWEAIKAAAVAIFGAIKDFWDQWGGQITELFQSMWDLVKSIFDAVVQALADVIKSVFDGIKAFWDKWGKDITTFFKAYLEALKLLYSTVFAAIFEAIKFIFNEIKAFWDKWGATITEAFKGIFEILKTLFGATFNAIFIVLKAVFTQIKAFWDTWGATITTLFKTVFEVVKTVFQGAWNTIKIVVETVIGVISGIIKTWLAVFKGDWAGAWENAKSVVTTIWNGITGLFKNAFQTMVKIGKDIIQGLINGISNMKDAVMKKTKEISEGMAEQIKRFFGIHSPSRLTTGYGENIAQGLANGIDNKSKTAAKAAKKAAQQVNAAFKESFASAQHKYKVGTLDTSQYITALQGVQGQYAKTSAQYRKVTEEIAKMNKNVTKEQEKAAKDSFNLSKEWIDKQTQANQLSLTQQLVAWEKVQARYKAGSDERKAAEEAAGKVRLEVYNQLTQAGDDFLAKTKAINENVAAEELRLNQVYEQAVEQRAKSINDFAGLFDAVVMKSETTGQQLLDNLRGQVDYLATWASSIETLAARGIDKGLLEELRQMGPKAAPELAALNQLTDSQLAEYSELWRTKSAESRAIAVQELQGMRQDTDLQIQQLRAKANIEMDGLKKDFEAKVKAIRSGTANQFNILKADLPTIGKQAMQGLLNGLSSMQGPVTAKAREIANSVRSTMQKALDIHSPSREMAWIGEMAGQGLVQGMAGMMSSVRQQAHDMAVAVQPSVSPAAGATAASGTTTINMEGLFAGAVFNVRRDEDIKSLAQEMAYELFALTQGAARGAGGTR